MKKILLIEDSKERQQLFMNDTDIDLSKYSDILYNAIDEKYDEIFYKLKNGSFDMENYSIIISHKSAFGKHNSVIIEKLKDYCKIYKKPLIFFSGGIDENYYYKSEYKFILTNSKTFYSQNIKLFLEAFKDGKEDILMLLYGRRWRLDIALNVLEKLNFFLQKNGENDIDYDDFTKKVNIHLLNQIKFDYKLTKDEFDEISKDEIEELKVKLYRYIQESIRYE